MTMDDKGSGVLSMALMAAAAYVVYRWLQGNATTQDVSAETSTIRPSQQASPLPSVVQSLVKEAVGGSEPAIQPLVTGEPYMLPCAQGLEQYGRGRFGAGWSGKMTPVQWDQLSYERVSEGGSRTTEPRGMEDDPRFQGITHPITALEYCRMNARWSTVGVTGLGGLARLGWN